ncbi:MAG: AAA family ATPase [Acidobacteria bacterium]|jgi:predicted ATPase|nr:AAA family ATPase [Acidobacteriota bacterium]
MNNTDSENKLIREIIIKNFKSIAELRLELGRFNVLIGENGSGKTNILEAIALGSAAAANKLDNEFLSSRGIRVTGPELMRSAFDPKTENKEISLAYITDKGKAIFNLKNDNQPYSKWVDVEREKTKKKLLRLLKDQIEKHSASKDNKLKNLDIEELDKKLNTPLDSAIQERMDKMALSIFIIYSPENTSLRIFEQEGQILPLGIKGEGLFKLIKTLLLAKDKKPIMEIKENLKLFDWFDDFNLPEMASANEFVLRIKDRFLSSQLNEFDQRSANEGFLFLLFYLSLFISKDTPVFFAIDNLEASFNPKLCVEVSKILIRLCKEKKKQVIVTTHNPSILDGLNLHDPEERLFVIKRNTNGQTIAKRINKKPEAESPVKLSEAWTRGYIGGLPMNF